MKSHLVLLRARFQTYNNCEVNSGREYFYHPTGADAIRSLLYGFRRNYRLRQYFALHVEGYAKAGAKIAHVCDIREEAARRGVAVWGARQH